MFLNIISIQNLSLTRGMDFFSGVWHLNLWTEHMSASINKHQVFFCQTGPPAGKSGEPDQADLEGQTHPQFVPCVARQSIEILT
jgi:hypothetical protein